MRISLLFISAFTLLFGCSPDKTSPPSNALINSTSPYLLEHAYNPVDWFPWGEAALSKARKENKLVIISIGYAACHWCHVMERQSFSDTTVSELMNEHFVSIKVDREERPDVDDIYMTACLLSGNGHCGWPLNVFALPDGRPVWAGTYFPKKQWLEVLDYFQKLYESNPEKLLDYAERLQEGINLAEEMPLFQEGTELDQNKIEVLVGKFLLQADFQNGGTRMGAPKFPLPSLWQSLQVFDFYQPDKRVQQALDITLEKMARGGIHDQLGGGFSRYSTDEFWLVPHFEKMLYDNAQMIQLYSQAYQKHPRPLYEKVVRECIAFLERELQSEQGAFYASLNADSEGEEGRFYVWKYREVQQLIPDTLAFNIMQYHLGLLPGGNWELGKNVLTLQKTADEIAKKFLMEPQQVQAIIDTQKDVLFKEREKRIRPDVDYKILTAWNSMTVSALCTAYRTWREPAFLDTAEKTMQFLLRNNIDKEGNLYRTWTKGTKGQPGFLDDYAALILALTDLYQCTFDEKYLFEAQKMANRALQLFENQDNPLFYFHDGKDINLIRRQVDYTDNVIPSSNALFAEALLHLGKLSGESKYLEKSKAAVRQVYQIAINNEIFYDYFHWMKLAMQWSAPSLEVIVIGDQFSSRLQTMDKGFQPDIFWAGSLGESPLPLLANKFMEGQTTIYVCRDKVCQLPVTEINDAQKLIEKERLN